MHVTLYSTHCPQCVYLEKVLRDSGIEFEVVEDLGVMRAKGMASAPQLEVDGKLMNMQKALRWINEAK